MVGAMWGKWNGEGESRPVKGMVCECPGSLPVTELQPTNLSSNDQTTYFIVHSRRRSIEDTYGCTPMSAKDPAQSRVKRSYVFTVKAWPIDSGQPPRQMHDRSFSASLHAQTIMFAQARVIVICS